MTYQDYKDTVCEITTKYFVLKQKELEELYKNYVESNMKYFPGDIVEDHFHKIKVESVHICKDFYGDPEVLYKGVELKKDNTPKKRQKNTGMYGCNIIGGWKK